MIKISTKRNGSIANPNWLSPDIEVKDTDKGPIAILSVTNTRGDFNNAKCERFNLPEFTVEITGYQMFELVDAMAKNELCVKHFKSLMGIDKSGD